MDIHHNDCAELENKQRKTWKYYLQQHYYNIVSLKFNMDFITSKDIQHFRYICKLNLIHLLKS